MRNIELDYTGERYLPTLDGEIRFEHLHRYIISLDYIKDKEVLDIASGEGYGSAILATKAKKVTGVDIDVASVKHAEEAYSSITNLCFKEGAADAIPLPDSSVDVVVSFETIEHHDKHREMLQELKRVLRPDGLLIISSPNRPVYSEARNFVNPFHVKELDFQELDTLLKAHFSNVEYYGQTVLGGSFVFEYRQPLGNFLAFTESFFKQGSAAQGINEPTFFVAFCSEVKVEHYRPSILMDPENDLVEHIKREATRMKVSYDEYYQTYEEHMKRSQDYVSSLEQIIKEKEKALLEQENYQFSIQEYQLNVQKEHKTLVEELTGYIRTLEDHDKELVVQIEHLRGNVEQLNANLTTKQQTITALENSAAVRVSSKASTIIKGIRNRIKPAR